MSEFNVTDAEVRMCAKICKIASKQGWLIDDLCNRHTGCNYVFCEPDGRRIHGGIAADKETALLLACKAVVPVFAHFL